MNKSRKENRLTGEALSIFKEPKNIPADFSWGNGKGFLEILIRKTTAHLVEEGHEIVIEHGFGSKEFSEWKERLRKHCVVIRVDEVFYARVFSSLSEKRGAFKIYWSGKRPKRSAEKSSPVQLAAMQGRPVEEVMASMYPS